MEKLLSTLQAMLESKTVPSMFKVLLFLSIVAWIMSSAGFPVVTYTEKLAAKVWEHQKLFGGLVGGAIGLTVVQAFRPLIQGVVNSSTKVISSRRLGVTERVTLVVAMNVLLFILVVGTTVGLLHFLAWAVS